MVLKASTETVRIVRDGEGGGEYVEVGGEGDYIPIATLSPPESVTSALRWAATVRAGHYYVSVGSDGQSGQSQDSVHKPQPVKEEPKRNRTELLVPLTSLTPYR